MRAAALVALCLLLAACAPDTPHMADPDRADSTMATPPRFLALGDSYTIGEAVAPAERWPAQLAARLRAEGVALGAPEIVAVTGWTTDELDAGIDDAVREGRVAGPYDLVTLLVGVNDQYRGRDAEGYRARLRALLGRAVGFAADRPERVVLVSIPDWGATPFVREDERGRSAEQVAREIDAFNAVGRDEAGRAGVAWADITPLSRTQGALVAPDGLHPSGDAYTAWTDRLLPVARAALARTQSL